MQIINPIVNPIVWLIVIPNKKDRPKIPANIEKDTTITLILSLYRFRARIKNKAPCKSAIVDWSIVSVTPINKQAVNKISLIGKKIETTEKTINGNHKWIDHNKESPLNDSVVKLVIANNDDNNIRHHLSQPCLAVINFFNACP